jgi:hypothetical protein
VASVPIVSPSANVGIVLTHPDAQALELLSPQRDTETWTRQRDLQRTDALYVRIASSPTRQGESMLKIRACAASCAYE